MLVSGLQDVRLASVPVITGRAGGGGVGQAARVPWDARRRLGVVDPIDPVMILFTVGRLAFIPVVILTLGNSTLLTALALAVFIGFDVYDGVLGRHRGTDGPARRALDSVIDRAAIQAVYVVATAEGLLPVALLVLMLARDVYCTAICSQMMRERWIAIRADWLYKVLNLSLAGWVILAPLVEADVAAWLFGAILAWGAVVTVDLARGVRQVRGGDASFVGGVVSAGDLRRSRRTAQ